MKANHHVGCQKQKQNWEHRSHKSLEGKFPKGCCNYNLVGEEETRDVWIRGNNINVKEAFV